MSLFAQIDGVDAVIESDGHDSWHLYLTRSTGLEEHRLDTRELAMQMAEQKFGIPFSKWEENPTLNRRWIIQHLSESLDEIKRTIEDLKNPTYDEGEFLVAMSHAYHHMNTAWNARFATHDEHRDCDEENFSKWRRFPKESDLLLE